MSLSEEDAYELLTLMRSGNKDEIKIQRVIAIKTQIKHQNVDSWSVPALFAALRAGVLSSNNTLFQHSFSCLGHLIKRVKNQDATQLRKQVAETLPMLVEKMGDNKDKVRDMALNPLVDLWQVAPAEVERAIKENGLSGKNPKLKESSLEWLSRTHALGQGLSIKPYTAVLVTLLEDANDGVREKAKYVVVDLFKDASDAAKADLKKSLQNQGVRKTIMTFITTQITDAQFKGSVRSVASSEDMVAHSNKPEPSKGGTVRGAAASAGASKADNSSSYLASLPGAEMEDIKPSYVNTQRELEHMLAAMLPDFEGRESEQNWAAREKNVLKLRELVRGNAPSDFQHSFLIGIKSLTDGIMKAMTSLRTKLASSACQLIKDLAITCGPGMDPMLDIMLPALIKLCAGTKKITAEAGQVATALLISNVSYHNKVVNQLWLACQDKNVQPRLYATGWLRCFIEAHATQKAQIEHGEGIITIEKCLKRGLTDANPGVREGMRQTFWKFYSLWHERGEAILDAQDANTQKLLQRDNPHGQGPAKASGRPGIQTRNTTQAAVPTRPSIKEQILAARRKEQEAQQQQQQLDGASFGAAAPAVEKTGLSSAPMRPQRPIRPKTQMPPPEPRRPDSASSNGENSAAGFDKALLVGRATSPSSSTAKSAVTSPSTAATATQNRGMRSPPISPASLKSFRVANRNSPLAGSRKLTILEQLNHSDPKVRVEGVITVNCLLAKRMPPNHEPGSKLPTLPPQEHLRASLTKLLNDPQQEVVEAVIAPEILKEMTAFVPFDQLVPKVLLHCEPDTQHLQSDPSSSLVVLKDLLSNVEAAELLFRVISSMGQSGPASRKFLPVGQSFTTTQRRRILHGALIWMTEVVNAFLNGAPNEFLQDQNTYRLFVNRLIALVTTAKEPNVIPLANLLKAMQQMDEDFFNKILATFDSLTQRELHKAWGMSHEQQNRPSTAEEQVAAVEEVLGAIPDISGTTMMLPPPRPGAQVPDTPASMRNEYFNIGDEELTMINPVSALPLPPLLARAPPPTAEEEEARAMQLPESTPDEIPDLLRETRKRAPQAAPTEPDIKVYQDPEANANGTKMLRTTPPMPTRTKPKAGASAISAKPLEQQIRTLSNLLRRLKSKDIDTHGLRKLAGVIRENPVRSALQEHNGDSIVHHDIWNNGQTFEDLLEAVLTFLNDSSRDPEAVADVRAQALSVLKQLVNKAAPYFRNHEVDVFSTLIQLRGYYPTQSLVSTSIEEVAEDFIPIADPSHSISSIVSILAQDDREHTFLKGQSWCLALSTLSQLIRTAKPSALPEARWQDLGAVAVKALEDEDPEIRRSCTNMCVVMQKRIGDQEKFFDKYMTGLDEGHRNLLTYYFARGL